MIKFFKVTGFSQESIHGGVYVYQQDTWTPHQELDGGRGGYHLADGRQLPYWLTEGLLWEAQGRGDCKEHHEKTIFSSVRLTKCLGELSLALLRKWCINSVFEATYHVDMGKSAWMVQDLMQAAYESVDAPDRNPLKGKVALDNLVDHKYKDIFGERGVFVVEAALECCRPRLYCNRVVYYLDAALERYDKDSILTEESKTAIELHRGRRLRVLLHHLEKDRVLIDV